MSRLTYGLAFFAAPDHAPQGADRPDEQRDEREDGGREDHHERRQKGEAGPGADVGVRGRREGEGPQPGHAIPVTISLVAPVSMRFKLVVPPGARTGGWPLSPGLWYK